MATNPFYILEAANLFCGDADPSASKHLTLDELKLPDLAEIYQEHTPGGGSVQVEFAVGIAKLEPTFKLKGYDPALLRQFGLGQGKRQIYTAYGVVKDKRTGRSIEAKSVIEARLGKVAPDAFKKGELQGHEYALNEVMRYEVYFDGVELFYWDFFTNTLRIDGVDVKAEENSILRIS